MDLRSSRLKNLALFSAEPSQDSEVCSMSEMSSKMVLEAWKSAALGPVELTSDHWETLSWGYYSLRYYL